MNAQPGDPLCQGMKNSDKEVCVMQVIRTTNECRGAGTKEDPMRRLTQFWSLEGDLLCEKDPQAHVTTAQEVSRPKLGDYVSVMNHVMTGKNEWIVNAIKYEVSQTNGNSTLTLTREDLRPPENNIYDPKWGGK